MLAVVKTSMPQASCEDWATARDDEDLLQNTLQYIMRTVAVIKAFDYVGTTFAHASESHSTKLRNA